jgi:hypothetical protein
VAADLLFQNAVVQELETETACLSLNKTRELRMFEVKV